MAAGRFSTNQRYCVKMTLAKFNTAAEITHSIHVGDLLHELGIDINFSTKTICWNDVQVDMKKPTRMKED